MLLLFVDAFYFLQQIEIHAQLLGDIAECRESFGKQDPPYPSPARRNLGPIRLVKPYPGGDILIDIRIQRFLPEVCHGVYERNLQCKESI